MELAIINRPQVFPYRRTYQIAKRIMDLTLCLLVLPVALPLMGILALLVRLDSPGPALFVQERIGQGGRSFWIYKFRTMSHNLDDSYHRAFMKAFVKGQLDGNEGKSVADGNNGTNGSLHKAFAKGFVPLQPGNNGNGRSGTHYNLYDDLTETLALPQPGNNGNGNAKIYKPIQASQVTRIGRILRKASLDELPQIFNVLKGEMSLVGPRPNVRWEVEEYQLWHHERLEVLPGITGLAQVRGRSGIKFDNIVQCDVEYVEQQSLALDLKVLWWTLISVSLGTGAE